MLPRQKKLEIVIPFERMQRRIDVLQKRFPMLQVETRSSFFVILSCHVEWYTEEDRQWLFEMKEAQIIEKFRCKERDDR